MIPIQKYFEFEQGLKYSRKDILGNIELLVHMHKEGRLGGQTMPEDSNPGLEPSSRENYNYFTLPMALNYQRNSYKLWEAAKKTYEDEDCNDVFSPSRSANMETSELKEKLTKHKVALQPNRHTEIWQRISNSICTLFEEDIRNLFLNNNHDVSTILEFVQVRHKKSFPYLGGAKICVYWLYVMEQYANVNYTGREHLSIAPDTHVIQSSIKLGLVDESVLSRSDMREFVSNEWRTLLSGTRFVPIDIHTPLWLWSRGGFKQIAKRS